MEQNFCVRWLKKNGVKKFIFASTCSNYGISSYDEFAKENTPFNPVSLYAESKIDSENYLKDIEGIELARVAKSVLQRLIRIAQSNS